MVSTPADHDRLLARWGVDTDAIAGLGALLDGMRATYARVEALAADLPSASPPHRSVRLNGWPGPTRFTPGCTERTDTPTRMRQVRWAACDWP